MDLVYGFINFAEASKYNQVIIVITDLFHISFFLKLQILIYIIMCTVVIFFQLCQDCEIVN